MKLSIFLFGALVAMPAVTASAATLVVLSDTQKASSQTAWRNDLGTIVTDTWTGSYDLGVTGITSGGSSLPNAGNEASGSGAFYADHTFGANSWDLSGWASGTIDAGLGSSGTPGSSIGNTTILGGSFQFYVDSPFTLTLTGSVFESFTGNDPSILGTVSNQGGIALFASVLDGQLVNQSLIEWDTNQGSSGGTYSQTFNSGVFRLTVLADAVLSSNTPDAFGTQFSSYDVNLTVTPVPEPGGVMLLGAAGLWPLVRRRRRRKSEK